MAKGMKIVVKKIIGQFNELVCIGKAACRKHTVDSKAIKFNGDHKFNAKKVAETNSEAIGKTDCATVNSVAKHDQIAVTKKTENTNVSRNASNPNGESIVTSDGTKKWGEPISLATGEELLEKEDGRLNSILPFIWKRFYRTSAVELQHGLGYGWSHSLSHQLHFLDDHIEWQDNENRFVPFPYLSKLDDKLNNIICDAILSFGQHDNEFLIFLTSEKLTLIFERQTNTKVAILTGITDRHQNKLTIQYNHRGQIMAISSSSEDKPRRLAFSYVDSRLDASSGHSLIAQVELQTKSNNQWQTVFVQAKYSYNDLNQLITVTNAVGDIEKYEYDSQNVILKRTVAGGAEFYWQWEKEGKHVRCLRQWSNYAQLDDHYQWNDEENSVTITHKDGSQTYAQHNIDAKLVKEISASGCVNSYEYNSQGKLTAKMDGEGNITHYQYLSDGLLSKIIYPDGNIVYYDYLYGEIYSIKQGIKEEYQKWRFRRNFKGDLIEFFDPQRRSTQFDYNPQGKPVHIRYPDGSDIKLVWSEHGDLLEELSSMTGLKQYGYNEQGQLIWARHNQQETRYTYDALRRLIKIVFPDNTSQEYQYSAYSEIIHFKDSMGRVTEFNYAAPLNLLTEKRLPNGEQLKFRYDNNNLLMSAVENQKGEVYQLHYTLDGMLSEEIGFDNIKTTYRYNGNNELIEKCEFGDQHGEAPLVTSYERNILGQIKRIIFPDGEIEHYEYDSVNRLVSIKDNHNVLVWEYNNCNQLTAEHQNWATIRHYYDEDTGLLSGTKLPDGQVLAYHHRQGLLRGMTLESQPIAAFNWDSQGRERERRQGNGLVNRYHYDVNDRLISHQVYHGFDLSMEDSPSAIWKQGYHYQADSELVNITGAYPRNYRYDDIGQLISVSYPDADRSNHHAEQVDIFHYDSTGNQISDAGMPSHAKRQLSLNEIAQGNRLLFYSDRHFEYDRFGNLITEKRGKNQCLVTHYEYDCRHRLIKVTKPNLDVITYTYDAFNRRTSKTVAGKLTEFVWQGDKLIAETSDNDNVWRSYIYEAGSFVPLALVEGHVRNAEKMCTYWYQTDHLGTPQGLTGSLGESIYECQYKAFGEVRTENYHLEDKGIKPHNPLRFQGQYYDEETGFHYNYNRYYDPSNGRFITQDPIGLDGGMNLYQYVPNPLLWIDPLGLSNSGILNKNLGGIVGDKLQAHHVIPVETWGKHVDFLENIGLNNKLNSASNGILIPGSQSAMKADLGKGLKLFHQGSHSKYSNFIDDNLKEIKIRHENGLITDFEARNEVRKLQMDAKNKIWSGDIPTKQGRLC